MNTFLKSFTLAAIAVGGWVVTPASAQNSAHGPGDLILTIQNPGGTTNSTTTNIAVLGNTGNATLLPSPFSFRDATPGSFTQLINLASTFSNFNVTGGSPVSWFDLTTLYIGAADYRGAVAGGPLLTGDPSQTLYLTKARTAVGTVGQANSIFDPIGSGFATTAVNNIQAVVGEIEAVPGSVPVGTFTAPDNVSAQNPFTAPGVQGAGYGVVNGGVQKNFGPGSFGTFGAAGAIESALDLYRVQYVNNTAGQYGFGAPADGSGQYLGTITVAQNGDVGFLKAAAVPEPSSLALMGLVGLVGFASRRRRSASVNS